MADHDVGKLARQEFMRIMKDEAARRKASLYESTHN